MQIPRSIRLLIFAAVLMVIPAMSFAGIFVSISIAPPALPVYTQPLCPGDGYLWTPGYWSYGDEGYYWVPGTWVMAPQVGFLWTPGYWGWGGGAYAWHAGYWGPHIGFYGGVNYGFGYVGHGYEGGYWENGHFSYNRSVTNVNITSVHVYNRTVINNVTVNRVSYNGGAGGIAARPSPEEARAVQERHIQPTAMQAQHERTASSNRALLASVNHGRPAIAATPRPGDFSGRGVVAARATGESYHPGGDRGAMAPRPNNSLPRPGNNAPRSENTGYNHAAPRNNVPRPPNNAGRENAPQGQGNARAQSAPRSENQSRPQPTSRPASAPHPEKESRPPGEHEERPR
jgi:hypothetical protein